MEAKVSIAQAIKLSNKALTQTEALLQKERARYDERCEEWIKDFQARAWFGNSRKRAEYKLHDAGDAIVSPAHWIMIGTYIAHYEQKLKSIEGLLSSFEYMSEQDISEVTISSKEMKLLT